MQPSHSNSTIRPLIITMDHSMPGVTETMQLLNHITPDIIENTLKNIDLYKLQEFVNHTIKQMVALNGQGPLVGQFNDYFSNMAIAKYTNTTNKQKIEMLKQDDVILKGVVMASIQSHAMQKRMPLDLASKLNSYLKEHNTNITSALEAGLPKDLAKSLSSYIQDELPKIFHEKLAQSFIKGYTIIQKDAKRLEISIRAALALNGIETARKKTLSQDVTQSRKP